MRRVPSSPSFLLALVGLGVALEGCEPKEATTAADYANLPIDLVSAFCDWQARCCTSAEIATAGHGRYATADQCKSAGLELAVRDQLGLAGASINEGQVVVNTGAEEACITAYRDRPCNSAPIATGSDSAPDVSVLLLCPGGFVGKVPLGRRCDVIVDCVPGAHCYFDPGTADGICVVNRQEGEPCAADADCAPGLACRGSDFICAAAASIDGGLSLPASNGNGNGDGGTGPACTGSSPPSDGGSD